jgi:hypothetical protein
MVDCKGQALPKELGDYALMLPVRVHDFEFIQNLHNQLTPGAFISLQTKMLKNLAFGLT